MSCVIHSISRLVPAVTAPNTIADTRSGNVSAYASARVTPQDTPMTIQTMQVQGRRPARVSDRFPVQTVTIADVEMTTHQRFVPGTPRTGNTTTCCASTHRNYRQLGRSGH
jgi:hypothetical protein